MKARRYMFGDGWKDRFESAFRELLEEGAYPGMVGLNEKIRGHRRRTLNGRETQLRLELMNYYGVALKRGNYISPKGAIPQQRQCGDGLFSRIYYA